MNFTGTWIKALRVACVIAPIGAAALGLVGCGGGGATGTTGGGGGGGSTLADLAGTVFLPGLGGLSRQSDDLTPVAGAEVTLKNAATDAVVSTTTTNTDGEYEFDDLTANTDYYIEVVAEVEGRTFNLKAVVTTDDDLSATEERNIDPLTTVAAEATLDQLAAAKQTDSSFIPRNLEAIAKDIEEKSRPTFVAPDLSDTSAVNDKKNEFLTNFAPDGNYLGSFGGNGEGGMLAGIVRDGKFVLFAIDPTTTNSLGALELEEFPDGDDDGGNFDDDNGGSDDDDAFDPTEYEDEVNERPVAVGTVDSNGVIFGETRDGETVISGIIIGDKGVGVWRSQDGDSGWWKIQRRTFDYAGLYQGFFDGDDAENGGYFSIFVGDNGKLFFHGYNSFVEQSLVGAGTVNSSGAFTFNWVDNFGNTGTTTGTITDDTISGLIETIDTGELYWEASRAFDPADLFGSEELDD